jgi:integrase
VLLNGFKDAMDNVNKEYINIAMKEKKEKPEINIDHKRRNIIFHSWRHLFCTLADNETDMKKVKKASGHLSDSVFKRYSSHIDENDVREVGKLIEKAYESIIPFRMVS